MGSTLLQSFMLPQNTYHYLPDSVLLLIYLIPPLISLHKNQSPQDKGCIYIVWEWTLSTLNKTWTQKLLNNYFFHEWIGSLSHLPVDILKAKTWFYLFVRF